MRSAAFVGLVLVVFASRAIAAEPSVYRAVVIDPEVKVRAGPSDNFPDTGTLKRGHPVIVEREENNGWLAITAPHDSVSWIAFTFVEDQAPDRATPKHGLVHTEGEVTLAAGKAGAMQPLEVRREKIPQGTTVLLIGPPVEFANKKWWPIAPPPGDVRYIPKTAVQFDKPVNNNAAVRISDTGSPVAPPAGPIASVPGPGNTQPAAGVTASKPAVNHPLWAQAETAEREGRLSDAEKAYFELAAIMNGKGGDHDIANLCYTRIHTIREKKRLASGTAMPPNVLQPPPKEDRGVRPGTPQPIPPAAGTNTSAADDRAKWSGPGTLRRTALTPDGTGKRAYALETSPGVVKVYVIAAPGLDLEKYLGKRVDVYGVSQRSGLSQPYVVATGIEPAQ